MKKHIIPAVLAAAVCIATSANAAGVVIVPVVKKTVGDFEIGLLESGPQRILTVTSAAYGGCSMTISKANGFTGAAPVVNEIRGSNNGASVFFIRQAMIVGTLTVSYSAAGVSQCYIDTDSIGYR